MQTFITFDIVNKIISYSSIKDTFSILSISKFYYCLRKLIIFDQIVPLDKIINSKYFNNFTNIILKKLVYPNIFPNRITHLTINIWSSLFTIPNTVTHLTYNENYLPLIKGFIPNSVTHDVTHLTFGYYFDQPTKNAIPDSVTHLTFDSYLEPKIDSLPISLKEIMVPVIFVNKILKLIPFNRTVKKKFSEYDLCRITIA